MFLQAHLNNKNTVYKQEISLQKPYFYEYHFFYITPPDDLRSKISTWILQKKCTPTNLTLHKFSANTEILKSWIFNQFSNQSWCHEAQRNLYFHKSLKKYLLQAVYLGTGSTVVCENIRLSSPHTAKDVSPEGTSAPQRRKFYIWWGQSVWNLVRSSQWW